MGGRGIGGSRGGGWQGDRGQQGLVVAWEYGVVGGRGMGAVGGRGWGQGVVGG